jgi:hypothetical protein
VECVKIFDKLHQEPYNERLGVVSTLGSYQYGHLLEPLMTTMWTLNDNDTSFLDKPQKWRCVLMGLQLARIAGGALGS